MNQKKALSKFFNDSKKNCHDLNKTRKKLLLCQNGVIFCFFFVSQKCSSTFEIFSTQPFFSQTHEKVALNKRILFSIGNIL